MSKQELTSQKKDNLLEILKENIEAKALFMNQLSKDLIIAKHRIWEDDKIFQKIKDMIC